jgi:hypothetical protein
MNKIYLLAVLLAVSAMLFVSPMVISGKPGSSSGKGVKICNDGYDNDGDGLTDFPDDPGCSNKNDQSELNPNIECDDGTDNADADSLADYNDPGCSGPTDDDETDGACDDLSDNDGDTYIDYPNDPGCLSYSDINEINPSIECDDSYDNDGDNYVDYNDAGCSGPTDDDETNCGDEVCEGGETVVSCPEDCATNSCEDTDGGFDPFVSGTVSGYTGGAPYSYDDACNGTKVFEWYCMGDTPYGGFYDCQWNSTTCSGGACV